MLGLHGNVKAVRTINRVLDGMCGDVHRTVSRWFELAEVHEKADSVAPSSSSSSTQLDNNNEYQHSSSSSWPVHPESDADYDTMLDQEEQMRAMDNERRQREEEEAEEETEQGRGGYDGTSWEEYERARQWGKGEEEYDNDEPPADLRERWSVMRWTAEGALFRVTGCTLCDLCCKEEPRDGYCVVTDNGRLVTNMTSVPQSDLARFRESYMVCYECVTNLREVVCARRRRLPLSSPTTPAPAPAATTPPITPVVVVEQNNMGTAPMQMVEEEEEEEEETKAKAPVAAPYSSTTPTTSTYQILKQCAAISAAAGGLGLQLSGITESSLLSQPRLRQWAQRVGFGDIETLVEFVQARSTAEHVSSCFATVAFCQIVHQVVACDVSSLRPAPCECGLLILALLQYQDSNKSVSGDLVPD